MIVTGDKPRIVVVYEDSDNDLTKRIHQLISRSLDIEARSAGGYKNVRTLCHKTAGDPSALAIIGVVDVDKIHRLHPSLQDGPDIRSRLEAYLRDGSPRPHLVHAVALRWNAETIAMAAIESMKHVVRDADKFLAGCTPDPRTVFEDFLSTFSLRPPSGAPPSLFIKQSECEIKLAKHLCLQTLKGNTALVNLVNRASEDPQLVELLRRRLPEVDAWMMLLDMLADTDHSG